MVDNNLKEEYRGFTRAGETVVQEGEGCQVGRSGEGRNGAKSETV